MKIYNDIYKKWWLKFNHHCLFNYALPWYLPSTVFTITTSPSEINKGTLIWYPVSMTAFLVAPVAVSPLTAGSVSITLKGTLIGKETPNTSPS